MYPSQASFDGGARSDGICMPVSISAAKIHVSGFVWLGFCDRPSGLGGRLAKSVRSADCACAVRRALVIGRKQAQLVQGHKFIWF